MNDVNIDERIHQLLRDYVRREDVPTLVREVRRHSRTSAQSVELPTSTIYSSGSSDVNSASDAVE
jgi:hypothetical protein